MATQGPTDFSTMTVPELKEYLKAQGHKNLSKLRKPELIAIAEGRSQPPAPSPRGRKKGTKSTKAARSTVPAAPTVGAAGSVESSEDKMARIRKLAEEFDVPEDQFDRTLRPIIERLIDDAVINKPDIHEFIGGLLHDYWHKEIDDAGINFGVSDLDDTEGLTPEQIDRLVDEKTDHAQQLLIYIAGVIGV